MSSTKNTLDIKILDRELRVACPAEEREELLGAVAYLDKKMSAIRDDGKIATFERITLMAALNITHELLTTKVGHNFNVAEFKRRIEAMQAAVDASLAEQETLF